MYLGFYPETVDWQKIALPLAKASNLVTKSSPNFFFSVAGRNAPNRHSTYMALAPIPRTLGQRHLDQLLGCHPSRIPQQMGSSRCPGKIGAAEVPKLNPDIYDRIPGCQQFCKSYWRKLK